MPRPCRGALNSEWYCSDVWKLLCSLSVTLKELPGDAFMSGLFLTGGEPSPASSAQCRGLGNSAGLSTQQKSSRKPSGKEGGGEYNHQKRAGKGLGEASTHRGPPKPVACPASGPDAPPG